MTEARIDVRGVRETTRALDRISADAGDLTAGLRRAADRVLGDTRSRTRRRTGELAGAWSVASDGALVNPLVYAGPMEMGDPARGIEPTHAAIGAIDAGRELVVGELEGELAKIIKRHGG